MSAPPVQLGPGGLRRIQRVAYAVARGLAQEHGQHQFYALAQVQAQAAASQVDAALLAWVYAVFVTRDDFDAFFAMRETPGAYAQLRAAISASEPRGDSEQSSHDAWDNADLDDLMAWLAFAVEP